MQQPTFLVPSLNKGMFDTVTAQLEITNPSKRIQF
jgi:hypothetical protein